MKPVFSSEALSTFFDNHLPITGYMGLQVESYDGQTLVLYAPLEPNINDKATAFGGSLYNVAVMACWGLAFLKTQEHGLVCNQVVAEGHISYKAPVHGAIRARCSAPEPARMAQFIDTFNAKGRASIVLNATVECSGKVAVEFEGKYAILPPV